MLEMTPWLHFVGGLLWLLARVLCARVGLWWPAEAVKRSPPPRELPNTTPTLCAVLNHGSHM